MIRLILILALKHLLRLLFTNLEASLELPRVLVAVIVEGGGLTLLQPAHPLTHVNTCLAVERSHS